MKHLHVIYLQDSNLEEQHCGEIPEVLVVKNDSTKDLLTICLDRIFVKFKAGKTVMKVYRQWCLMCR